MMSFEQAQNYLLKIFARHNFLGLYHSHHQESITIHTCQNGTAISLCFPGYKTEVSAHRVKYDYRVDITRLHDKPVALSHCNLITDIYHKLTMGKMNAANFYRILSDFAVTGFIDLPVFSEQLAYTPIHPSPALLERVAIAHRGKTYHKEGNQWDLTLEELFYALKLIVLQEDLNYPIAAGKLGRKMPFMRYVETIVVSQKSEHDLEEVIARALLHGRPELWAGVDYSFVHRIK